MRTLQDLAREAVQIQDAPNLSGLVHGWSAAIRDLRIIMPHANNDEMARHPINKCWAAKCADLAGLYTNCSDARYLEALAWCESVYKPWTAEETLRREG